MIDYASLAIKSIFVEKRGPEALCDYLRSLNVEVSDLVKAVVRDIFIQYENAVDPVAPPVSPPVRPKPKTHEAMQERHKPEPEPEPESKWFTPKSFGL